MKTPYPLRFTASAEQHDFLKLDGDGDGPLAGWDRLFWGEARKPAAKDAQPQRGIYSYYPVDKIRPGSDGVGHVRRAQGNPHQRRQGRAALPCLHALRQWQTFYIGSGETWRLRQYKEAYHERFWINLARHMSASRSQPRSAQQKARAVLIIDGDPVRAKETAKPDSYYVKLAIDSIPAKPYEVVLGHELAGGKSPSRPWNATTWPGSGPFCC